jgi:hypothetical protein
MAVSASSPKSSSIWSLDPVDVCRREVDLVDHRDDFQVVLQGQVQVGQGLGLDALAGIHQQQGPLTGRQGPCSLHR